MSQKFSELTTEQKIGQLFFIGIAGEELDIETKDLLQEISPGGICLFSRNTKNAAKTNKLLSDISDLLPFQPFLSLDQEGGLVDRLRRIIEPIPSAKDISKSGDIAKVERLAEITAESIRILGFNLNFAPVVDVTNKSRSGFIMDNQSRTFGNSKEDVVEFTSIYLKTLQKNGVLGCLKHFPGIGSVKFDPHEELPSVPVDRDELYATDLYPFIKHLESNEIYTIMTGHTTYPNLDLQETDSNGKLLPSSLSHNIITELLRKELNYQGLVLTDDLEMGAIVNNYGIGEATKMAFMAGSDFLVICNRKDAIKAGYNAMINAYNEGKITEERINQSLERVFKIRQILSPPLTFNEKRLDELSLEIKELKDSL